MHTNIAKLNKAFKEGNMTDVLSLSRIIVSDPSLQYDAVTDAKELMMDTLKDYVNAEDMHFEKFFRGFDETIKDSFQSDSYPATDQLPGISYCIVTPLVFEREVNGSTETYVGVLLDSSGDKYTVISRYALDESGQLSYEDNQLLNEVIINNHRVGVIHRDTRYNYSTMEEEFKFWHMHLSALVHKHLLKKLGLSESSMIAQKVRECTTF